MTVQIIRGTTVNRPTPDPLRSSVLDHATVETSGSFGLNASEGLWPSYNCLDTLVPTELCPDPVQTKQFSQAEWIPSFDFAVYGGVYCTVVGLDQSDMQNEVRRVFALNEGKGVERALAATRFVADNQTEPRWDAPTDLTPGTAITPAVALALLEGYAAAHYAGMPTIHMPRAAASILNERIVWEGDKAYTRAGSKVAFGGGYDSLDAPASLEWDMYATGEVYVERSDMVDVNAFVLPGQADLDVPYLADNRVLALAERMYRVAVDCFVAKATGTVGV